ncbi:MAG: hypothetical protein HYT93_00460 [Parcubacteria group bacterium]|nr:hypothetical protein [Parcubacteria group bacterium]
MYIKIHKLYTYAAERQLTIMLFMGFLGIVFLYVLLVGLATFNISAQRALQNNMQSLYSNISDLESEYTGLNNAINHERAATLGFVEPKKEIFAFRQRLVQNEF